MADTTKIDWADATFNPWLGCTKVAAGCTNCYAADMAGRLGVVWGPNGTRRRTAESTWRKVEAWNRRAACTCNAMLGQSSMEAFRRCPQCSGNRPRVFPSLCDPFENWDGEILWSDGTEVSVDGNGDIIPRHHNSTVWADDRYATMDDLRRDFFDLIDRCLNLDFLLLTKRPENIQRMWPDVVLPGVLSFAPIRKRKNVWLIFSASTQEDLEAGLPHLLACRDLVPVLGLSLEPLIGPIDLIYGGISAIPSTDGFVGHLDGTGHRDDGAPHVDWIIVGGESGPRYRPMQIKWLQQIAVQCQDANVPCWVKQDCGPKSGQQGRIPDWLWSLKELPGGC